MTEKCAKFLGKKTQLTVFLSNMNELYKTMSARAKLILIEQ